MEAELSERLEGLRRLIADEVVPLEGEMFRGGFLAVEPRLLALRDLARGLGLFAPHLPRAWGGAGLTLPELALAGEVLGWSPLGHYVCNCQAPDAGNMELRCCATAPKTSSSAGWDPWRAASCAAASA